MPSVENKEVSEDGELLAEIVIRLRDIISFQLELHVAFEVTRIEIGDGQIVKQGTSVARFCQKFNVLVDLLILLQSRVYPADAEEVEA
ncbi:MAG TPA: hypothetical protein VK040_07695 [Balneolaceae bacterium]|nr:hypothetical protein [Balneolaceae bacterium]